MARGNEESHEENSVYPVSNQDLNPESPKCKTRMLATVLWHSMWAHMADISNYVSSNKPRLGSNKWPQLVSATDS